jgi:hypothetical protein
MQIALIIGAIVLTALLGLSKIARGLGNLTEKKSLCSEFMQTFRRFVDSVGEDREAFGWLLHRSHRMQELVASQGNFAIKCKRHSKMLPLTRRLWSAVAE